MLKRMKLKLLEISLEPWRRKEEAAESSSKTTHPFPGKMLLSAKPLIYNSQKSEDFCFSLLSENGEVKPRS